MKKISAKKISIIIGYFTGVAIVALIAEWFNVDPHSLSWAIAASLIGGVLGAVAMFLLIFNQS